MITFTLNEEYIELQKLLKVVGAAESGGEAKHLISEGRVTVDGKVENRRSCKIRQGQIVECERTRVQIIAPV